MKLWTASVQNINIYINRNSTRTNNVWLIIEKQINSANIAGEKIFLYLKDNICHLHSFSYESKVNSNVRHPNP